jgi:PAS domain S-box-containing protein
MCMSFSHDDTSPSQSAEDRDAQGAPPTLPSQSRWPTRDRQHAVDRFDALVQVAPDATVVVDANGSIRLVNRLTQELFGYSAEELLGQSIELLVPDLWRSLRQRRRAEDAHVLWARSVGGRLDVSGRKRDGREFQIEVSLGPIQMEDESLVFASIRDVTQWREAHAAAEAASAAANQDLRALQTITDTALSHLALDDLLAALLERAASVLQVDNAAVLLMDASGETLTLRAAHGPEESAVQRAQVPVGQGFAGRIAATRQPFVVDDLAAIPIANPILRERLHYAVGVPLLVGDQVLGVTHIGTVVPRHFTDHDVQLLQQVADRMALAIDRARAYGREQLARQTAEAALALAQISEQRYQRLVEGNIIGLAVSDGEQIFEANEAFLQLVGYTRADLAAGHVRRTMFMTPDSDARSQQAHLEALATGASAPSEREYVRKDGSHVATLAGVTLLQRDPVRFVTFALDLTERKQLELALARRVAELETIMEAVPEPLMVYDHAGRIVMANSAYHALMARLIPAEPPGETFSQRVQQLGEIFRPDGSPLEEAALPQNRALRGEVLVGDDAVDVLLRTPKGDPQAASLSFTLTGAPLRDPTGRITGAVVMSRDITVYKRLEREREVARASELAAQEVAKQLDSFFAVAAHDIRNPITVVSGFMQLAQRRMERLSQDFMVRSQPTADSGPAAEQALDKMSDSLRSAQAGVDQLERLVDYLFDVARARSGALKVTLADCDLAALVVNAVTAQRAATPKRRIELDAPASSVLVQADGVRLDQVFGNYLTNALKYSPADQPVTVRLEIIDQQARVSVVDHGPGLEPAEQRQIWELFHRAPGVEAQPGSGKVSGNLGLGLYICKQLVELHPGGRVGVESAVDQGSTFWFSLPLAASS